MSTTATASSARSRVMRPSSATTSFHLSRARPKVRLHPGDRGCVVWFASERALSDWMLAWAGVFSPEAGPAEIRPFRGRKRPANNPPLPRTCQGSEAALETLTTFQVRRRLRLCQRSRR
jgi:hypothetical protein